MEGGEEEGRMGGREGGRGTEKVRRKWEACLCTCTQYAESKQHLVAREQLRKCVEGRNHSV